MADHNEYLCRLELGAGHRKFGIVAPRKEPDDDDEGGGSGTDGFEIPRTHPLLGAAAQFSGEAEKDNPVAFENKEGKKELQYRLEAKLDKKLQATKSAAPSISPGRS